MTDNELAEELCERIAKINTKVAKIAVKAWNIKRERANNNRERGLTPLEAMGGRLTAANLGLTPLEEMGKRLADMSRAGNRPDPLTDSECFFACELKRVQTAMNEFLDKAEKLVE